MEPSRTFNHSTCILSIERARCGRFWSSGRSVRSAGQELFELRATGGSWTLNSAAARSSGFLSSGPAVILAVRGLGSSATVATAVSESYTTAARP
jgi:hypothetical protein